MISSVCSFFVFHGRMMAPLFFLQFLQMGKASMALMLSSGGLS